MTQQHSMYRVSVAHLIVPAKDDSKRMLLTAAIERAKREVIEDVLADRVAFDVRDFSGLHDFVDANEYGGMCDDAWPVDADGNPDVDLANALQGAIDAWIKTGALMIVRAALEEGVTA